ncbi:MAG: hypothetical protein LAO79_18015 [Acidobacteriia bacterium]|nr:hypothetical protein [Terriglobia bacterium]
MLPPDLMQETFYPLGFPVTIATNSQAVLDAAHVEWDSWRQVFDEPPVRFTFHVSHERSPLPETSSFHAHGHQFVFAVDANNLGICDTSTHSGVAWITTSVAEDATFFRYHLLEGMALEMLVSLHLTPFHAGCVARQGRGALLCGDSEAGKSSLSYACARRGWTYLSDDACYLLRRCASERIVLGHPHRVRLRPDAPRLFPELAGLVPIKRGNGKMSLDVRTTHLQSSPRTAVDRIVLLRRTDRNQLTRVDPQLARDLCEPIFYWWDPRISSEQQSSFDALLSQCEVFSLDYSNPDSALDLLER